MKKDIFAAAVNCIDGRVQEPVIELVRDRFRVDHVDMITHPGPDRVLSESRDPGIIASIKERVMISLEKHGSKVIVIAGHHDCAANPAGEEEHKKQIREAVDNVKNWGMDADVFGVWVDGSWKAVLL